MSGRFLARVTQACIILAQRAAVPHSTALQMDSKPMAVEKKKWELYSKRVGVYDFERVGGAGCLFTGAVRPRARRPNSEHARSPLGGARPHCVGNTTQELAHCCCGGGSDGDCELTADGCTAVRLTAGGRRLRRTATARFAFAPRRCD